MTDYLEQSLEQLKHFEGSIPWMYLDTVGRVTAGVGLMLPDAGAAAALPFRVGGIPADRQQIEQEFARVQALPKGRTAGFYRAPDSPELPGSVIDGKLRDVLCRFEGSLRVGLPGYDALPGSVKLALLDMAYNLGPEGLLHGYPRLLASLQAGRWSAAAEQCLRRGPSAARNAWTRQQILAAATLREIKAEAETIWHRMSWAAVALFAAVVAATAASLLRRRAEAQH